MTCARGCCETQREHYLSVGISASAMPTRNGPRIAHENQREKNLSKDLHAYREMRRNGVQPKQIDGCHELQAKAETKHEVEAGTALTTKAQREQLKRIMGDA